MLGFVEIGGFRSYKIVYSRKSNEVWFSPHRLGNPVPKSSQISPEGHDRHLRPLHVIEVAAERLVSLWAAACLPVVELLPVVWRRFFA